MKSKLITFILILAIGAGAGYYFYTQGKTTPSSNSTVTETKDDTKTTETDIKEDSNKETSNKETPTNDSKKTTNVELEKQIKIVSGDIEKIKSTLSSNNIKANVTGDLSKDSKVTLSGNGNKISKIDYIGEVKDGKLSRNLTIALKHPVTKEFDVNEYAPAKALIEAVTGAPLNDFEFSDGLTERMTTTRDSKMNYDFIAGDNYKISVNINKNADETITTKVELK